MLKYRKKEIVVIAFILIFALVATHHIYYKFKDSRNVDYNSETLDVTFHEKSGDKVNLSKITPVTDSVGLSSKAYTFTIKNNTNRSIRYSINVLENEKLVMKDKCEEYQIPKNLIKLSIHKSKENNNIYFLSDLINGNVLTRIIKANQEEEYTMRFWITNNNTLTTGIKLHYHGIIDVADVGTDVATTIN